LAANVPELINACTCCLSRHLLERKPKIIDHSSIESSESLMASPMSFIRRYQNGLMAVFGVLLMVVFLITMILPQGGSMIPTGPSGKQNPVVVQWTEGQLTRADLDAYRTRFFMTSEFLNRLSMAAAQKKGQGYVRAAMDLIPVRNPSQYEESAVDESVLVKRLLVNEAKKEGIIIGDTTIDDYLSLLMDEQLFSKNELEKIARDATDNRMDLRQVRESLREELAAQQMVILRGSGMRFTMMPAQNGPRFFPNPTEAFQFFNRANTLISAEVVPFKVEDYLSKVTGTPSNAEMKKLYDDGKYSFYDATRKSPGFKRFRKMNLQYFEADINKFLEVEMAKVTDKELQEEYDKLVKEESPVVYEVIPDTANDPELAPGQVPAPEKSGDAAPAPEQNDGGKKDGEKKDESATEPPKDAAAETPADNKDEKKDDGDKKDDGEKKDGGLTALNSNESFVSFGGQDPEKQDAEKQEPQKEEPKEEGKSEAAPAGDKPQNPAPTPETAPVPPTENPATQVPEAPQSGAAEEEKKPEKRLRPLKDVEENLRRRIKSSAANDAMQNALDAASKSVRDHQNKMLDQSDAAFSAGKEFDQNAFPKYDGNEIAKKLGLVFIETGLFAENEYTKTSLGKEPMLFSSQFQQVFPTQLFSQAILYDPSEPLMGGMGAKRIVLWFAEKREQEVPSFEDAKEDIVSYWKHQLAFDAAVADAKKAADESNASKKPLAEKFGEKAKLTGQFSWYTTGMRFGLSQPVGVEDPGEEFMEAVFDLKEGQAGVAPNATREIVYLVKNIATEKRDGEDMNREFITRVAEAQNLPMDVQGVTQNYLEQLNDDFNNEMVKEYNIQWIKH
jgi:hypothetical protein